MLSFFEASLAQLSVHRVGNKSHDEFYVLSDAPVPLQDEVLNNLLNQFFLRPFEKVNEVYRFFHCSGNLELNEICHFAAAMFADSTVFHEAGQSIAKFLYEVSGHPNIKPGEIYIAQFKNVQMDGELHDAIGIFKSETKDTYLKVQPDSGGFGLTYEQDAININKLDKGCLILNSDKAEGYNVIVIDQTNRSSEAVYWKDEFLKLRIRNDNYNQTSNTLNVYKNFITNKVDEEFEMSKADKIDLLNRSMKYFKEKEVFDMDEFSEEVIGNEQAINSFKNFKQQYENEYDTEIKDS